MFEKATRLKLRFNFKGLCTIEDLWDLSLEDLNSVFQGLNSQLKEHKKESLLDKKTKQENLLDLTINIVKHIFETKQREQKERENAIIKAERKQKILARIAAKHIEEYDYAIEELNKLIDEI